MAEGIVDDLEPVEVDEQQCALAAIAVRHSDRLFE
jgi:hypothetical protein